MTYKENYLIFMSLVDEYDPDLEMSTTDEDIRLKLAHLYNPAYRYLGNVKTDSKSRTLSFTYTGEDTYEKVKLPNCRQVKRIFAVDSDNKPTTADFYYISDKEVMISQAEDVTYYVEYIPKLTSITEDTADDFELEISDALQDVLPYKVACDLFKTDPSANYQAFTEEYRSMMQNMDTNTRGMGINIIEGEF